MRTTTGTATKTSAQPSRIGPANLARAAVANNSGVCIVVHEAPAGKAFQREHAKLTRSDSAFRRCVCLTRTLSKVERKRKMRQSACRRGLVLHEPPDAHWPPHVRPHGAIGRLRAAHEIRANKGTLERFRFRGLCESSGSSDLPRRSSRRPESRPHPKISEVNGWKCPGFMIHH